MARILVRGTHLRWGQRRLPRHLRRDCRRCWFCALLTQVAEYIFLGDAAVRACAGDLTEVEVVVPGHAAHQRRRAQTAAGVF